MSWSFSDFGEGKEAALKTEEEKARAKRRSNQVYNGLMIIGLMTLLALILLGVFGHAGSIVTNFFVGVFGYAVYGYCFGLLATGILTLLGFRPRVSLKIVLYYCIALMLVLAMCHMHSARPIADLSYGEYLKACYTTHSTATGVIGGVLFYPLTKAYTLCMIFAALLLLGVIAAAVIAQMNHELNFRMFGTGRKRSKKQSEQPMQQEEEQEPDRTLYNGTMDGRLLRDSIGHSVLNGSRPTEYEPLESTMVQPQPTPIAKTEDVRPKSDYLVNPEEVDRTAEEARQAAIDFLYHSDAPTRPIRSQGMQVDVSRSVEHLRGASDMPRSANPTQKRIEKPQDDTPSQTPELEDKYKWYSNHYRMEQLRAQSQASRDQVQEPIVSDDDAFVADVERSLNASLFGTSESNSFTSQSSQKEEDEVQDCTASNPEPLESFEAILNRNEEEKKARELEEKKARMREELARRRAAMQERQAAAASAAATPAPADKPQAVPVTPSVIAPPVGAKPKKKLAPYVPPDLSCLRDYKEDVSDASSDINEKIRIFEQKMRDINIDVNVVNVVHGPTFTRIEFETTTQVSKITARVNDITMWLEVQSLRLLAPIPGKGCCGIEIPNPKRGTVGLKTIIQSPAFQNTKSGGLYFALGKDIDGTCYVSDITKFPHGLVAGASGAGKSVCLNAMLCSMLYKYSPEDLRLILVDPKVVEFNVYRDLPHLLLPNIVTEEKQVINALKWAVDEMERRYQMLTDLYVSNITQYNAERPAGTEKMPYILLVIDEVGDIILSPVGKEFEMLVKRLAAKARAAGIHLILATQRPSVDVITGTIKSNLPTRIAFAVTSGVDSKTILDSYGAEKLLRLGDMLYRDTSVSATPVRVQGAFIDNPEVREIVRQVKERNEAVFDEEICAKIMTVEEPKPEVVETKPHSSLPDTMCIDALEVGLANKTLSISFLQRKLGLGFQRAGKIIDWMKDMGYLQADGKNNAFVLSEEEVEEIKRKEMNGDTE